VNNNLQSKGMTITKQKGNLTITTKKGNLARPISRDDMKIKSEGVTLETEKKKMNE